MSEYNVLEDKESYKNIYGPVLLIARIMLMILIIVRFVLKQVYMDLFFVITFTYLIEVIMKYKKTNYKEDKLAIVGASIASMALLILSIGQYI